MMALFDNPAAYEKADPGPDAKPISKKQGRRVLFPKIDPWPEPVDGAAVLDSVAKTYSRYLVLPPGAADAKALWTVHAHAHDCFPISPLLIYRSPERRCGKTTALLVLGRLVPKPLHAASVTGPVLFRAIDRYKPTLLLDEADAFIRENEEVRGLLNNGHCKENAAALRNVGEKHEVRAFSVWAPKALCSIESLAATLQDRSITIDIRRKRPDEKVDKLRIDRHGVEDIIRAKIARWVADNADALRAADPVVPESLDDRAADNWRPLLAIADHAGGHWPKRARDAAVILSLGRLEETGAKEQLLADIKSVWPKGADRISSADLVDALVSLKDRPWAEWIKGRPLNQHGLARLLKGYGVRSKDVRVAAGTLKGYELDAFADTFSRYVADGNAPVADAVALQNGPSATLFPAPVLDCRVVADVAPLYDRGDAWEPEEGGQP